MTRKTALTCEVTLANLYVIERNEAYLATVAKIDNCYFFGVTPGKPGTVTELRAFWGEHGHKLAICCCTRCNKMSRK